MKEPGNELPWTSDDGLPRAGTGGLEVMVASNGAKRTKKKRKGHELVTFLWRGRKNDDLLANEGRQNHAGNDCHPMVDFDFIEPPKMTRRNEYQELRRNPVHRRKNLPDATTMVSTPFGLLSRAGSSCCLW
jgi:hypothetical protein